jgi:hypothetical protein
MRTPPVATSDPRAAVCTVTSCHIASLWFGCTSPQEFMLMPSTSMVASWLTEPCTVSRCCEPVRAPPTLGSLTFTPGTSAPSAA